MRWTASPPGSPRRRAARRRRGRGLRRRRPDQREGLPARQVRTGRAAHAAASTTTAASACRRRPRPRSAAFGLDRGLPFPLADIDAGRRRPVGRQQPRRDDAAGDALPRGAAASRRSAGRGRPPRDRRRRRRPAVHLQPLPGTDLALANGLLHLLVASRQSTTGLHRRPYQRVRRRSAATVAAYWPERVERMTGVPAAELRRGWPRLLGTAPHRDDPDGARRRAAQHGHRHRRWPASTSRSRSASRAAPAAATAASPARATGRAAASTGRRPTSCPATADRRPRRPRARRRGCGASPGRRCPARAGPPTSCSTRSAARAASARCWCSVEPGRLGAPRGPRRPSGCAARPARRSRHRPVGDGGAGRRGPARRAVGRGDGTMTNLEGRVRAAAGGRSPRRQACGPTSRSSPAWPRGSASGTGSPADPRAVFDELAPGVRGRARRLLRASPTSGSRPSDGRLLAVPGAGPPRHATAVRRAVRHRRRARALPAPSATGRRPRSPTPSYPAAT